MADASEAHSDFPPGMVRYIVGFLRKGPHWGEGPEDEAERIQEAHVANNRRMRAIGAIAVAGPFLDDGDLRGLLFFRETSPEKIRALVAEDPAIAQGRLVLDLRPWLGFDGLRTNDPP
jgi:uncharacterized protein